MSQPISAPPGESVRLFPGDSEMAGRMRALDWPATDVGPPTGLTEHFRGALRLCLTSRFPILIWWGPAFTLLYNDASIPFLGPARHPRSLGRPGREVCAEIWEAVGPLLEGVRANGRATWTDDFPIHSDRAAAREEAHVRFNYGPILAADGRTVDGVFCPCTVTTGQPVGARERKRAEAARTDLLRTRTRWRTRSRSIRLRARLRSRRVRRRFGSAHPCPAGARRRLGRRPRRG